MTDTAILCLKDFKQVLQKPLIDARIKHNALKNVHYNYPLYHEAT